MNAFSRILCMCAMSALLLCGEGCFRLESEEARGPFWERADVRISQAHPPLVVPGPYFVMRMDLDLSDSPWRGANTHNDTVFLRFPRRPEVGDVVGPDLRKREMTYKNYAEYEDWKIDREKPVGVVLTIRESTEDTITADVDAHFHVIAKKAGGAVWQKTKREVSFVGTYVFTRKEHGRVPYAEM